MLKRKFQHKQFFNDIKLLIDEQSTIRQASLQDEADSEGEDQATRSQVFDNNCQNDKIIQRPTTSDVCQQNHSWLNEALISISTTGESIVLSDGYQMAALIKLKMNSDLETISKYSIKPLQIKVPEDEYISSVLCLPIMSSQRTGLGLVDWTAIVIGYSSGYTKFYDEQSCLLMSLRFIEDEVINLRVQTLRNNTNARSECHFSQLNEELTIVHKSCAIIIDGFGLFENLTIAKKEATKEAKDPAYDAMNLPCVMTCKRWKLEGSDIINDCDNYGIRRRSTFDTLVSSSISQQHDSAKICGQSILTTGQNPFVACYRESNISTVHSYSDWIGSIFSIWKQKPPASKTQMIDSSTPASLEIKDKDRLGTSMVSSPDKRLAAITDDFGRVILLDVTNLIAIRIWKGYRYAQCGWVEVPRDQNEVKCPRALFLVIYAPKRGLLEIWSTQRGPRVAAFNVGKDCLLLYNNHRMLNMRAELLIKNVGYNRLVEQCYSENCYLFNPNDDSIYNVEVPYTCCLSKDGDLKSRDQLLLNEFTYALKQEESIEHLCEILFKILLVESRAKAIHKMCTISSLVPENLKKVMLEFQHHIFKCYQSLIVEKDHESGEQKSEPPYDVMTVDDLSIVELCDRILKLCDLYENLSGQEDDLSIYTRISGKTLTRYNEHPEEIDELAEKLGWSATEVARCISLLALEQSFSREFDDSPWPNLGEPLSWEEFISCFDLSRQDGANLSRKLRQQQKQQLAMADTSSQSLKAVTPKSLKPQVILRLIKIDSQFLNTETLIKTASLMYTKLFSSQATKGEDKIDHYDYVDPATRLALLYQFWLNSKLCNYWMTWENLQQLTRLVSNDLKVESHSSSLGESYLIDACKQVYSLILESDNLFGAIIATATIKNDTLRLIRQSEQQQVKDIATSDQEVVASDDSSAEKVQVPAVMLESTTSTDTIGWENLYIDAERLALLNSQLEDVLFLSLLLHYSPGEQRLVNRHIYKIKKISVASILRGGPTLISELVAQWAVQTNLDIRIFIDTYRDIDSESGALKSKERSNVIVSQRNQQQMDSDNQSIYSMSTIMSTATSTTIEQAQEAREDGIEQALELMHHIKTSYPNSMAPDVLYMNCFWEYCLLWSNNPTVNYLNVLDKSIECLQLFNSVLLRHKLAYLAWKTFFQRTFERLTLLVETHSALLSAKTARMRDAISKRELNMSEDCLDGYVKFCLELTDLMLQTHIQARMDTMPTFKQDDWWISRPTSINKSSMNVTAADDADEEVTASRKHEQYTFTAATHTLIYGASSVDLMDAEQLVELNRLCTIVFVTLGLKITKAYPVSLIGSEARQLLRLDLQGESKQRYEPLDDLRRKFALKCISTIASATKLEDSHFHTGISNDDDDVDSHFSYYLDQPSINYATGGGSHQPKDKDLPMMMFRHVITLCKEWQLDCDMIYRQLVIELYRCCNKDLLAEQMTTRVQDQSSLSKLLLKIASQRILILCGLSPYSSKYWRKNTENWSLFQPNVCQWLKTVQQEERERDLASLCPNGVSIEVISLASIRAILERITNHLDGQAERLAYNLIETLDSLKQFDGGATCN